MPLASRISRTLNDTTDKAHSYARIIGEVNRFKLPSEGIQHIKRTWENNRIESDHAATKKRLTPMGGLQIFAIGQSRAAWH